MGDRMKIHSLVWLPLCVWARCQSSRQLKCRLHSSDRLKTYNGEVSKTADGTPCAAWIEWRKAKSSILIKNENEKRMQRIPGNHCRNGRGGRNSIPVRRQPWCYIDKQNTQWRSCDIPLCNTPAYLRKCDLGENFKNTVLLKQFRMDFDPESCTTRDQFTKPEVQKFL